MPENLACLVRIDPRLCKGAEDCGICLALCRAKVLEPATEFSARGVHPAWVRYPERCTGCDQCMLYCPDLAVSVAPLEEASHA